MDDLLKDAIADAKAVRETALENAKIALEEAFTPRLQSMLSKKIQSEMEHEDDIEERGHEDEDPEEGEQRISEAKDYNSSNTLQLSTIEMAELLRNLPELFHKSADNGTY